MPDGTSADDRIPRRNLKPVSDRPQNRQLFVWKNRSRKDGYRCRPRTLSQPVPRNQGRQADHARPSMRDQNAGFAPARKTFAPARANAFAIGPAAIRQPHKLRALFYWRDLMFVRKRLRFPSSVPSLTATLKIKLQSFEFVHDRPRRSGKRVDARTVHCSRSRFASAASIGPPWASRWR